MKHVLLLLAVFSLVITPAAASEVCEDGMGMATASQEAETLLMSDEVACCDLSGHETDGMNDKCATMCMVGCSAYVPSMKPPSAENVHLKAIALYLPPANDLLEPVPGAFEPPPPRI